LHCAARARVLGNARQARKHERLSSLTLTVQGGGDDLRATSEINH
jgi:hypothetical protein